MAKKVTCATCKGEGYIRENPVFGTSKKKKCPVCGGSGYVYEKK